jgi:hypothetical protein
VIKELSKVKISWHDQRVQWNKENKCAREACQANMTRGGRWYNSGSNLHYCHYCARLINESAVRGGTDPLCTKEEEAK